MKYPFIYHMDSAEENARELISLMHRITNKLKTNSMYEIYHAIDEEDFEALTNKITEYNEHVKAIKELLAE